MALFRIRPTQADIEIAERISEHTSPAIEQIAKVLTWGADEHVICALAAGWWLCCRHRGARARTDSNHILLTTVIVTLLPHLLKSIFDQKRPDRLMIRGHLHGVPFSGKPLDAFPSGHAIHVGALASAASDLPPAKRNLAWSIGAEPGPDPDRSPGALDQRCDRGSRDRRCRRTAAQAVDRFRIVAPGIVDACGLPCKQGRRRPDSAVGRLLVLRRGLVVDRGFCDLGQGFVGLFLFGQGLVDQLHGLRIIELGRPGFQGTVARNLVMLDR